MENRESVPEKSVDQEETWEYEPIYEEAKDLLEKYIVFFDRNKKDKIWGNIRLGSWVTQNIDYALQIFGGNRHLVENLFDIVFSNEKLLTHIKEWPVVLEDVAVMASYYKKDPGSFLNDSEKVDVFIKNNVQRYTEHEARVCPEGYIPTDEELNAGVARSELESQVADAVFVLRRKGFNTFESGFGSSYGCLGEQIIGFTLEKEQTIVIPDFLREYLQNKGFVVDVDSFTVPDVENYEVQLNIRPTPFRFVELSEWKEIWDFVAESIPPISSDQVRPADLPVHQEFRDSFKQ